MEDTEYRTTVGLTVFMDDWGRAARLCEACVLFIKIYEGLDVFHTSSWCGLSGGGCLELSSHGSRLRPCSA